MIVDVVVFVLDVVMRYLMNLFLSLFVEQISSEKSILLNSVSHPNQLYFNDKQPEEIFETFRMNSVCELIQSIPTQPQELAVISYSKLPANFV